MKVYREIDGKVFEDSTEIDPVERLNEYAKLEAVARDIHAKYRNVECVELRRLGSCLEPEPTTQELYEDVLRAARAVREGGTFDDLREKISRWENS